jgi:hypothetical protein
VPPVSDPLRDSPRDHVGADPQVGDGSRQPFAQRAALKPASPAGPRSPVKGHLRLSVLTEALERLFYDDLDASCHARHVDWAATSNLA